MALPDFSSGAMENWGLITYRETAMLAGEKSAIFLPKGLQSGACVILPRSGKISHRQPEGYFLSRTWRGEKRFEFFAPTDVSPAEFFKKFTEMLPMSGQHLRFFPFI